MLWTFSLVLDGVTELTPQLEDALYEVGCTDALLGSCEGVVFLDFDRGAKCLEDAVLNSIAAVEAAGMRARQCPN